MKMMKAIIRESDKISGSVIDNFNKKNPPVEFDIPAAVIIGLLENIIAKSKSLRVLLEADNYDASDVITRSIFESHVYLKYILSADVEQRARLYAYSSQLSDFKLHDKITEETSVGSELRSFLGKTKQEILQETANMPIESEREKITNKYLSLLNTDKTRTAWYNFDGKTSTFETLCLKMDMRKEYEILYRIFSKDVHANRALSRIKAAEDVIQIGNFDIDPTLHISITSMFLMESSRSVLQYYNLNKELRAFNTMLAINQNLS